MRIEKLAKLISDKGLDRQGNGSGTDKRVIVLLNSLARKQNSRHSKMLWRLTSPELIRQVLLGNPFEPYPIQEEFTGEIIAGFVGIHEPFSRKEFEVATAS